MKEVRKNTARNFLFFSLLSSLFLLSSCGFQPVYGVNKYTAVGVETKLENIEIGNIPDREGQFLRNALIDRFYRGGRPVQPTYRLDIAPLRENLIDLDITKTAYSTRGQLQMETSIKLIRARDGATLMERTLRSTTSYNILSSEFATRVTEQNARENTLNDLARQIELQIDLYFKRSK